MRINYIVANYIGPLRKHLKYQELFKINPLFFFNKHLSFFEKLEQFEHNITVTFVFNDDIDSDIVKLIDFYKNRNNIQVVYRKNSGFSYGVWNDIIINNLNDYDYFFLIEDDYLPSNKDFLDAFLKRFDENIAFVCGLVEEASYERFPLLMEKNNEKFLFPSVSNGLISAESCKQIYLKYQTIFNIVSNSTYQSGYRNQIYFCKYFIDNNYNIVDTLDEYKTVFFDSNKNQIIIYGQNEKPSLINPILI